MDQSDQRAVRTEKGIMDQSDQRAGIMDQSDQRKV